MQSLERLLKLSLVGKQLELEHMIEADEDGPCMQLVDYLKTKECSVNSSNTVKKSKSTVFSFSVFGATKPTRKMQYLS